MLSANLIGEQLSAIGGVGSGEELPLTSRLSPLANYQQLLATQLISRAWQIHLCRLRYRWNDPNWQTSER
jgi:hypothetical protein